MEKQTFRKQIIKACQLSSVILFGVFGYVESTHALVVNGREVGDIQTRTFSVKEYCGATDERVGEAAFSPSDPSLVIVDYQVVRDQLWSLSGRTITETPPQYRFSSYSEHLNEFNELVDASGKDGAQEYRARYERERRDFQQSVRRLETSHSSIVVDWHCEGSGFFSGARGKVDLAIEVSLMYVPRPEEIAIYLAEARQSLGSQTQSGNGFYRQSDRPEVYLGYRDGFFCHVQNEDQMEAYGGFGRVTVVDNLSMNGTQTGGCGWPDGFYRRSNEPEVYRMHGGENQTYRIGNAFCHVQNESQMALFGGFQIVQVVSPSSDLGRGRNLTGGCSNP